MRRERRPHVGHSMVLKHGSLGRRMRGKGSDNGISSLRVHRLFVPIVWTHSTGETREPWTSSGLLIRCRIRIPEINTRKLRSRLCAHSEQLEAEFPLCG